MAPIHPLVWIAALAFQIINCTCIGGWLGGYGPTSKQEWDERMIYIQIGTMLFVAGLLGNIYHEEILRDIRRSSKDGQSKDEKSGKKYEIPEGALFDYVFYPHYLCEWIEWIGFWIIGGRACLPAQNFVINEITTMGPRALSGKRWYLKKFGAEKVGNKKAAIPGLL